MRTDGEREKKEAKLTARTQACSGKPEKDRNCRIFPVTVEEEDDAVAVVVEVGSIASSGTFLMARKSSWRLRLGGKWPRKVGQGRPW
jgi:hypothetical protein